MDTKTYFFIILAAIIALMIAVFQYFYKEQGRSRVQLILAFLRFLSVFLLLLLLINPTIESRLLSVVKPKLVVAVDNSSSIKVLDGDEAVRSALDRVASDSELNDKFDVEYFSFEAEINRLESLDFLVNKTNISKALQSINKSYNSTDALVLLTDGNQTLGADYTFHRSKMTTYPVAIGDTIPLNDIKIDKLNVNRYSFLNNTFPVEIFINYNGNDAITTNLTVTSGSSTVFRKQLSFDGSKNSQRVDFTLKAESVGAVNYNVRLAPITNEKNTVNNRSNFLVEVIDEQSKIALISDIVHPDIGMLKRAIETNKQRKVILLSPDEVKTLNEYQLLILYQPNRKFNTIYDQLKENPVNALTITGPQTDWSFLNGSQQDFQKSTINQTELYQATSNSSYTAFVIDPFDFNSLPPLESKFGTINFKTPHEPLLFQNINNIETEKPLLATFINGDKRGAILLGEGVWKWRAFSYTSNKSFFEFDRFINKLIQYLSLKKKANRLDLEYLPVVFQNDIVTINATYFDSNYTVDTRADLNLSIRNRATNEVKVYPLQRNGQSYVSNVSGLSSGDYNFTVSVDGQSIKRSGAFTVLNYNIEQQFTHANINSLRSLANASNGNLHHITAVDNLIDELKSDDTYKSIQRSTLRQQALIEWQWLLGLAAFFLALEWFIRKYHGKI